MLDALDNFLRSFCTPIDICPPERDLDFYGLTTSRTFYANQALIYRLNPNVFPTLFESLSQPATPSSMDGVYLLFDPDTVLLLFAGLGGSEVVEFDNDATFTYQALMDALRTKVGPTIWDNFKPAPTSLVNGLLGWYRLQTNLDDASPAGVPLNEIRSAPLSLDGAYFGGADRGVLNLPYRAELDHSGWTVACVVRWQTLGANSREEHTIVKRWNFLSEMDFLPATEEVNVTFNLFKMKGNGLELNVVRDGGTTATFSSTSTRLRTSPGIVEDDRNYLFIIQVRGGIDISLTWFVDGDANFQKVTEPFPFVPNNPRVGYTLGSQEFGTIREFLRGRIRNFGLWDRPLSSAELLLLHNGGNYWDGPPIVRQLEEVSGGASINVRVFGEVAIAAPDFESVSESLIIQPTVAGEITATSV